MCYYVKIHKQLSYIFSLLGRKIILSHLYSCRYHEDSEEWQQKLADAESALTAACCRCDALTREAAETASLCERLTRGIEENEALYNRVHELEGRARSTSSSSASGCNGLSASREKGRSVDSLSDLTNIDLDLDVAQIDRDRQVKLLSVL